MNCIPCFAIYAVLLQSASKIIRNNFRGYFKIGLQRANWIYFIFTIIHCSSPLQYPCDGQDCKNKKEVFFYNLRIFICVCYILTRSLCLISIVIKFLGFWISSTFLVRLACWPKFCRFATINNGGRGCGGGGVMRILVVPHPDQHY